MQKLELIIDQFYTNDIAVWQFKGYDREGDPVVKPIKNCGKRGLYNKYNEQLDPTHKVGLTGFNLKHFLSYYAHCRKLPLWQRIKNHILK